MQKQVEGFQHRTGRHCATTAISNLLDFHGRRISEAMCLGLGAGIDFFYIVGDSLNPTRIVSGRGHDLEIDCFRALGVPVAVRRTDDREEAWAWVKSEIDDGRPALIQADIRWLDYYRTDVHFGGHKVLVIGYDEEARTVLISDSEFAEPQTIPLAGLAKARSQTSPPWELANDWFQVSVPPALTPLEQAVPAAIGHLAQRMQDQNIAIRGLPGMAWAARDLPNWREAPDWQWCARFAYQIIEKRGTGGGAFRKMYAEFLAQAEPLCPEVGRLGLAGHMRQIAAAWTELAYLLREISDRDRPEGFDKAGEKLQVIVGQEKIFYEAALNCRYALDRRE